MKFMWGLLLGFALGVAAGLLLAPQSGEATRSQLGEQSVTLRDRSGSLTGDLRSRITNLSSDLRSRATDAMTQGQEIYSRTKDELSDRYGKAKSGDL
ncbi:MAG TPA: YtxH domain-containing protein [Ktedonobacteraceae bacterium]|nr:YtxH domain-containing protein [Ktedonobacteraceae bacterium]